MTAPQAMSTWLPTCRVTSSRAHRPTTVLSSHCHPGPIARHPQQPGRTTRARRHPSPASHRPGRRSATGVSAVVLNMTVTNTQQSGYITAWGDGVTRPTASNLNFIAGQTVPNLVVIPRDKGKVDLYNGSPGNVDLIADVSGYYLAAPPPPSSHGPPKRRSVPGKCAVSVLPGQHVLYGDRHELERAHIQRHELVGARPNRGRSSPTGSLQAVSCPSTAFCMAVGGFQAVSYNGATWSPVTTIAGNKTGLRISIVRIGDVLCRNRLQRKRAWSTTVVAGRARSRSRTNWSRCHARRRRSV